MQMAEEVPQILDPLDAKLARFETVQKFLSSLDEVDQGDLDVVGLDLAEIGRPLPNTVVVIPVAAHTEAPNVFRTLSQYANQVDHDPFAVHLHLNWPGSLEDLSDVQRTVDEIHVAKMEYPHLDLRVTGGIYDEPNIGHIRRAAWNATLLNLYSSSENAHMAIGLNHDIDLMAMTPRYISRVQQYYKELESEPRSFLPIAGTLAKHYSSPDYPNTSRAVYWSDFMLRATGGSFEAGLVIPFATYALRGGFPGRAITHETGPLLGHISDPPLIKGTSLQTSIRRHLDRLPAHGYGGVWDAESFFSDDTCRTRTEFSDMTEYEVIKAVTQAAPGFALGCLNDIFDKKLTQEQLSQLQSGNTRQLECVTQHVLDQVRRVAAMTSFVLDRLIHVPKVADVLRSNMWSEESVRQRVDYEAALVRENSRIKVELEEYSQQTGVPLTDAPEL